MANCPKCEQPILSLTTEGVTANVPFGKGLKGLVFSCPLCNAAIGASLDPIAVQQEGLAKIAQWLQVIERKIDEQG